MLEDRYIHKSVFDRVRTLLQVPPIGFEPYTVYTETELRLVMAKRMDVNTLDDHRVFLLEAYTRPAEPLLPIIVVETARAQRRPFELGNANGRRTECNVHVFATTTGQRKDFGSFIADNIGTSVPIYDYFNGSKAHLEDGLVEDRGDGLFDVQEVALKRDDLRQEASLDLWTVVSFTILTTK